MAELLKGAAVVAALNDKMTKKMDALRPKGIVPTLAVLRVGQRGDQIAYERNVVKRSASIGVDVRSVALSGDSKQEEVLAEIEKLNMDKSIHGVLVLRPLPPGINDEAVRNALDPSKDVDGITPTSIASVFTNSSEGFAPCTAQACIDILEYYGVEFKGKRVTVVGASLVVGLPVSVMLTNRFATVTTCHIHTVDLIAPAKNAEILIVAAGKAGLINEKHLSPGQVVVDVGINVKEDGGLCGDVEFEDADRIVHSITPVPGGVGTVTTSVLISRVVEIAEKYCN